jgi:hypothetical protein
VPSRTFDDSRAPYGVKHGFLLFDASCAATLLIQASNVGRNSNEESRWGRIPIGSLFYRAILGAPIKSSKIN